MEETHTQKSAHFDTHSYFQNYCPVDMRPVESVRSSTLSDVKEAVIQARHAQVQWNQLGFESRARLMKKACKRMIERRAEVLQLLFEEAGKTPGESLMSEAAGPLQYLNDWIKVARPHLKSRKLKINPLAFPGKKGRIDLLPRGVIGIIARSLIVAFAATSIG